MSIPSYDNDQAALRALVEAAEAYNSVLTDVRVLGLVVCTEFDGATIHPKIWREIT